MVVSLFQAEAVGRDLPVGYSIADLSEDRSLIVFPLSDPLARTLQGECQADRAISTG